MKYLICQNWKNTKGNHAGMVHLSKLIKSTNSSEYKLIIIPDIIIYFRYNKLISLQFKIQNYVYNIIYFFLFLILIIRLRKGDTIFFLEYFLKERNQFITANLLKKTKGSHITIYGLAHLTPSRLKEIYTKNEIINYSSALDYILTFGSSLTSYFISLGINKEKVITTFHYVDKVYYTPYKKNKHSEILTVIIMGMQMRDFSYILDIVNSLPSVKFIICKCFLNIENYFKECKNVIIKGFMPEDELKEEMNNADVSLNLMIDTVGSNVITTSMAMSLAMIVSDVGSIRNYCNESNAYLCCTKQQFIGAIDKLNKNRGLLNDMKKASFEQSNLFSFKYFYKFMNMLN